MTQLTFLHNPSPRFDGNPFDVELDADRLGKQLETVKAFMLAQSGWVSLLDIEKGTGVLTVSAGARLRDLRKPRFGAYTVSRRRRDGCPGTFEYRILTATREAA